MPLSATVKQVARSAGIRRSSVVAIRMCCERQVIGRIGAARTTSGGRILCYHSVGTSAWGVNDVAPDRFRRQLQLALADGYRFVPARTIAANGGKPNELAITFDDGLTSVLTNAAPVLEEFGIPWTLFVVSGWADGNHPWTRDTILGWRQIEQLAARGVEIGSHSVSHPDFGRISGQAAAEELSASRRTIEQRIGIRSTSFAIPLGQSMNWTPNAQALASETGYELIYAQSMQRRPGGTVARTFITRFDSDAVFRAALRGAFDRWEEWV